MDNQGPQARVHVEFKVFSTPSLHSAGGQRRFAGAAKNLSPVGGQDMKRSRGRVRFTDPLALFARGIDPLPGAAPAVKGK